MIMIRRRKPRIKLIDPFNSIDHLVDQGKDITEQKLASITKNMETIHESLLDTQNKLNEIWTEAASTLTQPTDKPVSTQEGEQKNTGTDTPVSTDDDGASSVLSSLEQLAEHEKELTKQKLKVISAHTETIHAALAETQDKLNNVWKRVEENVSKTPAGISPDTTTQTSASSASDQQKIPQPISTNSSDTAEDG